MTRKVYALEVEEQVCPTCEALLRKIGEEVRKELVYYPARYEVIEHVQYVYACRQCVQEEMQTTVVKAKAPNAVLPKNIASPSLLATIINDKYNKSIPLYRQEVSFQEQGLYLSRQTMANWMIKLYDIYLEKIIDYMHNRLLEMEYICADETSVQVLKEAGKAASSKSYMWVYISGRSERKQMVLYQYEQSRAHVHAIKYLKGYQGLLLSDGYQAYDKIEDVIQAGCWSHVRRKFMEALELVPRGTDRKTTKTYQCVSMINNLFKIEKDNKNVSYEEIQEIRQNEALPIVEEFFKLINELSELSLPKSHFGIALTYALNQEQKLKAYVKDGRIEISNNITERAIRPFTIYPSNMIIREESKKAMLHQAFLEKHLG